MSKGQVKLLTKKLIKVHRQNINQGMFLRAYLVWSLKPVALKYLVITYLFIKILCAKISCVHKAFGRFH